MSMTESRFFMWRAIFAMAHVDHVVTPEERAFLYKILAEQPFTEAQCVTLESDLENAQDVMELFQKILDQDDRSKFFRYARALVWCDGDFGEQEQRIMIALKRTHVQTIDFDQISNTMEFELDEVQKTAVIQVHNEIIAHKTSFWKRLFGK